jgi:hypothetical protein
MNIFITICLQKNSPCEGGGSFHKDLILQFEGEEFNFSQFET